MTICKDSDNLSAGLDPVIAADSLLRASISAVTNPAVGSPEGVVAGAAAEPAAGVVGGAPELPPGCKAS